MNNYAIAEQQAFQMFIDRNVVYCVSHLVFELAQKWEHFPEYQDELLDAYRGPVIDDDDSDPDDPEYREVFEHWLVTPYLAELLESAGETVIEDLLGLGPIWCRTTTGQAIAIDCVIEEICRGFDADHWVTREVQERVERANALSVRRAS